MRLKRSLIVMLIAVALPIASLPAATIVDFEGLPTPAPDLFYNGDPNAPAAVRTNYTTLGTDSVFGSTRTLQTWTSGGVDFNNRYVSDFASWDGWSWSSVQDAVSPDFTNQYASVTGGGSTTAGAVDPGGTYAVAFDSGAYFNLPQATLLQSAQVTNTTYAAAVIAQGNQFSKAFGGNSGNDPDLFTATFTGYSDLNATGAAIGNVEVVLADYRFTNNAEDYILATWLNVDLTPLGAARSVGIQFASTDFSDFGGEIFLNTPTYFALDNLTLVAVPEPTSAMLVAAGFGLMATRHRRKVAL